jgi:hypothetical protein
MTDQPVRWALVQWDDGTVSLTDISLLDKADDDEGTRAASGEPG